MNVWGVWGWNLLRVVAVHWCMRLTSAQKNPRISAALILPILLPGQMVRTGPEMFFKGFYCLHFQRTVRHVSTSATWGHHWRAPCSSRGTAAEQRQIRTAGATLWASGRTVTRFVCSTWLESLPGKLPAGNTCGIRDLYKWQLKERLYRWSRRGP